ncbi:hypothetical protein I3760_10G129600 [Carya illinoinensis]|nr:hypothetical protein I3760_10G129600 [Carya illinoinensis]
MGCNHSYMWRSLLATQEIVKEGMIWMVGNGEQLVIWHDKWLSQGATSRIFSPIRVLDENAKVKELILEGINCWNERLIKEIFDKDVVAQFAHVLWSCLTANDVWADSSSGLQKWSSVEVDFVYLWQKLMLGFEQKRVEMLAVIFAGIWHRRNRAVFEDKFDGPGMVIKKATMMLEGFQEAGGILSGQNKIAGTSRAKTKWLPPLEQVTKINFDASVDKVGKKMGMGVVARNHEGELMFSICVARCFVGDVQVAKAKALWKAMEMAAVLNLQKVCFVGDAQKVIKVVRSKGACDIPFLRVFLLNNF